MLQVLLWQERHVTTVGGSGLMVREGKVRIVKMRRDHSNRGAGSRPLGLPDADASHREDASPEDKAPEDGNARKAAAPPGDATTENAAPPTEAMAEEATLLRTLFPENIPKC